MAANVENGQFVDMFSQMIKSQVETLSNEQKTMLIKTLITELSSPSNSPSPESNMSSPGNIVNNSAANRRRLKKVQARRSERKKSVNAFMVFRSYYSAILIGLPQKARSPMLARMWRSENRQSLFSVLGAAYSKIRDAGLASGVVTLETFLQVAAQKVPIIPASEYFQKSGWAIVGDELHAVAVDEASVESQYPLRSNASPDDLISYCVQAGLCLPAAKTHTTVRQDNVARNIAFAALPQGNPAPDRSQDQIVIADFDAVDIPDTTTFLSNNAVVTPSATPQHNTMAYIATTQQQTYEASPPAWHWSPQIEPPLLNFDPWNIQDPFDPFSFLTFDAQE